MKASSAALAVLVVVAVAAGTAYLLVPSAGATGTLVIGMTDTPVQSVSHIYVTITDITLQGASNNTVSYKVNATSFDLLSLVNVTKMLGKNAVPVGNYTMVRFSVTSAVATIAGANVTLKVPSGELKVPLNFQVASGKTTTVVLDVTADMTNISAASNLRPVVTVRSIRGPG